MQMRADDSHVELRPKEEKAWETPTAQREEEERPVTQKVSERETELGQHCAGFSNHAEDLCAAVSNPLPGNIVVKYNKKDLPGKRNEKKTTTYRLLLKKKLFCQIA